MSLRMLIDARHPEETRVAVVNGQRIEEFDFEAADRRQLKGNIYLAKVTRVEPSLQAAFVEYGGNRHGFLAFSEIHPDYYQIPREDREALLREEAEYAAQEAHDDEHGVVRDHGDDDDADGEPHDEGAEVAETGGAQDEPTDALRRKRQALRRRYKIQEVIRRRQVLLIQVVKEERGSKGAALTTYLSLAGRYCVLMPNTAHGGGISRKISNPADRKRLKTIMAELKLPAGMGAIVRTAGLKRSPADIRRDFDYLTRLWDEIRERTLSSSAPALIHEDSNLVKRAIRDIYHRDIEQVIVEGAEGFAAAHRFMSMLMPTHAPKVVEYQDNVPLFQRFGVEQQLEAMYQPVVQLKSGGYLVINPTEALVSIDINSGRSTREYGIEETATKTNLEAAEEIGRQLRLRDMAGLVVIDFIDMEHGNNVRKVEKAMKDALRNDRARVQIGRISAFGLMEMSRQRLRTGVLEASTHSCPMCEGTGMVRSVSSAALAALRALEAEALRGRASDLTLRASEEVAVYLLNRKRIELAELEELYGVTIVTVPDEALIGPNFVIDASGPAPSKRIEMRPLPAPVRIEDDEDGNAADDDGDDEAGDERAERGGDRGGAGRGKRRRRRRGGRDDAEGAEATQESAGDAEEDADAADFVPAASVATVDAIDHDDAADDEADAASDAEANSGAEPREKRKRRRRGRRGKRDRDGVTPGGGETAPAADASDTAASDTADMAPADIAVTASAAAVIASDARPATDDAAPKARRPRRRKADPADAEPAASVAEVAPAAPVVAEVPAVEDAPKPKRRRKAAAEAEAAPAPEAVAVEAAPEAAAKPKRPRRAKATSADSEVAAAAAPEAVAAAVAPAAAAETGAGEATSGDATSDDAGAPAANDPAEPAAPPRKGWWQRTFG
ncbi:ribonuclease [alpha proteobacterium AAP81b]|nr:ribonuclease [alpha proteobacterium AAP81b]